ncbi:MAG: hypothetical protein V1911_04380 [Candidatus Micrarchaeota archaeon]
MKMPQDKNDHMTRLDKIQFLHALPEFLEEKSSTHAILFATFTFKIPRKKISNASDVYREYFHLLRLKLDAALLSDRKQFENRPILLLFPEKSKAHTPDHFHGFIFIHNSTLKKFYKNCVETITKEPVKKLDDAVRDNISLKPFLLDANTLKCPKSFRNQMTYRNEITRLHIFRDVPDEDRTPRMKEEIARAGSLLTIDNHKLYISPIEDIQKISLYSAKNFVASPDDFILESKYEPRENPCLRLPQKPQKK